MTEIETEPVGTRIVSILDPATGQRKRFLVAPTRGDNSRAKITLSREDRDARGKEEFKE
jgi:hypothetical protein